MSFRARLTLASAAAVAVAVVGASAITYALVRNELRDQVDETLHTRAAELPPRLDVIGDPDGEQFLGLRPERFGGVAVFTQLVSAGRAGDHAAGCVRQAARLDAGARGRTRRDRSRRSTRTRTSRAHTSAC